MHTNGDTSEDRRLLRLTHRGCESAARELWRRLSPSMLAYARSIVGDGAEDVVQSVFVGILSQPQGVIARVEQPRAWLMVLTRRSALGHLRSVRRENARRREAGESMAARTASQNMVGEPLSEAVGTLPRRLREVVVLKHIAGLTFDQVALALGANRNTTAAKYREAVRRLRLALKGSEHSLTGSTP